MSVLSQKISEKIKDWHLVAAVGLYHFILALYYKEVSGVSIETSWNLWTGHLIPRDLLEHKFLESIWNLHAQAPIFNILAGIILKLSPANYYPIMHYFNICLGAILCGMTYFILATITRSRLFSFAVSIILVSNPAIFLYEAFNIYDLLTSYLIMQSVFFIARYSKDGKVSNLVLFVLSLNLLAMTRASFHYLVPLSGLIFSCLIVPRKEVLRLFLFSLLLCLPTLGWYGKNLVKFGFSGTSSWMGCNFFGGVLGGYQYLGTPDAQSYVDNLVAKGIIDPLVGKYPKGVDAQVWMAEGPKQPKVELLTRNTPMHVNIIGICEVYLRSALNLIKYDPVLWLRSVSASYERYCRPSTEFKHLIYGRSKDEPGNAEKIALPVFIYENVFLGKWWMRPVEQPGGLKMGSVLYFVFPLSFVLYLVLLLRDGNISWRGIAGTIKNDPTLFVILTFVLYNTLVSCIFAYDENERYKFDIEQIFYIALVGICFLLLSLPDTFLGKKLEVAKFD